MQNATASLLSTQAVAFAGDRGITLSEPMLRGAVTGYVAGPSFPGQFADVNRVAHRWLFTDAVQPDGDRWTVDVAPMLSNLSIIQIGAAVLAAVAALLTVAVAKPRGKALAALGVSALLVGGAGWAAMEIGRPYIDDTLNQTTGDVRTIANVMVGHAEGSLHHWLNLTLAVGGALAVLGVVVTMLGAVRGRRSRPFATETRTSAQT